ncbi:hypothetical protein JZ785_00690 [Alicyclobacillus curvatus]|nr:hypothetical protein JZ785_00690 [Alicyclobacillus curvatus]
MMHSRGFAKLSSRIGLFLCVAVLPAALAGCNNHAVTSQNSTPPTTSTNSTNTATTTTTTTSTSNATSNAVGGGGGGQSSTNTSPSGTAATNTPTTSGTGTGNTIITTGATTEPVHVVLYNPTIWSVDTVHVSGRVFGSSASHRVTVLAKNSTTGELVSSWQVTVSPDGQFSANLPIAASTTPLELTFEATYPGATSAAITRYLTEIPMYGSHPVVMENTQKAVLSMGADFPIYLPTWLPQTISTTAPSLPSYSTTVAAKSFNYYVEIFQTEQPYAVNAATIQQTSNNQLATVQGTQFQSAQAADDELMHQASQVLPNASVSSQAVWLTGNLYATRYSDMWNTVVWHEGDWLLVVRGPSAKQNVDEAKAIAEALNTVYLPPTRGVVWIRNISDGSGPANPNTSVSFVEGANLYQVWSQGQIYNPLVLAASMKP